SGVIVGVRRDEAASGTAICTPPCHQLGYIVVGDIGQCPILAKELDEQVESVLGALRTGMVLPHLLPLPSANVVQSQRSPCRLNLRNAQPRLLTLGLLYRFGFAPVRAFGRAVKATTSDLTAVCVER